MPVEFEYILIKVTKAHTMNRWLSYSSLFLKIKLTVVIRWKFTACTETAGKWWLE